MNDNKDNKYPILLDKKHDFNVVNKNYFIIKLYKIIIEY